MTILAKGISKGFRAVALAALLVTPAAAQMPNINMMPEAKTRTPEEIERDDAREKAYKESLRKIPDAKAAADPWGNVRSTEAPKPVAKPKAAAPKRAKAEGPAAN